MRKKAKGTRKVQEIKHARRVIARESPHEIQPETAAPDSFPIYILRLGLTTEIVFPENREDFTHPDFWEQTVCYLVARHFGIPPRRLTNLPYCQRRARIVGDKVYYGEPHDPQLLGLIRKALKNSNLSFVYDVHEKRLREDVRLFQKACRGAALWRRCSGTDNDD